MFLFLQEIYLSAIPVLKTDGISFSFYLGMEKALKQEKRMSVPVIINLWLQALKTLVVNDPLRMAGATAFFTSFALPFILIILSQVLGLFYDERKVRTELFDTLSGVLGTNTMQQVVDILRAFRQLASNTPITIAGILFLFLVSTTLLMVIKGSINQIWRIKVIPGIGLQQKLVTRLRSFLIILGTAILFFLSILAEGVKAFLDNTLIAVFPNFGPYFTGLLNYLISVGFVTLWFAIIFRMLPDARAPWRVTLVGAFVTSILFNLGKFLLRILLVNSNLNTLYGASASIVLLLLFVFYSSLILYFGAAFTGVWAEHSRHLIRPRVYARHYEVVDVDE
jgi:membrane protein